eukprot:gene66188-90592_t
MSTMDHTADGSRTKSAIGSVTLSRDVLLRALKEAFLKLDPRKLAGNPVILATEVVAVLATVSAGVALAGGQPAGFPIQIAGWPPARATPAETV